MNLADAYLFLLLDDAALFVWQYFDKKTKNNISLNIQKCEKDWPYTNGEIQFAQ